MSRWERWVWYAFLGTFPWQTRLILWQADPSFIEWRSAAVYASDILMVILLAWALIRHSRPIRIQQRDWLLALLFGAAVLSLPNALHVGVGAYALVRFVQYAVFFIYLRYYAFRQFNADTSALAFLIGAVGQSLLGIAQYLLQHDVGLRWMGETLLRTDMRGVAVFYDLLGEKILRAYGTFPHPNILAAYLVLALWVLTWLWLRHGAYRRALWHAVAALLLIALYLTFARTVIAVAVLGAAVLFGVAYMDRFSRGWPNIVDVRRRLMLLLVTAVVVTVGTVVWLRPQIIARLTISASDEAVRQRIQYNADALATGAGRALHVNWTGVGIGNFTTWLSSFDQTLPFHAVQPAHNIFLLAYSEIGVAGLAVWLCWLLTVADAARRSHQNEPLIRAACLGLLGMFLLIGVLDHFFWTLQQGRILWWGVLALAAGVPTENADHPQRH